MPKILLTALLTAAVLTTTGAVAVAQTRIDLSTQSKNVDFTQATATRPLKAGPSVPTSCLQGEMFFNVSAIPGQNLNICVSNNSWVQLPASSGTGVGTSPSPTSTSALTDLAVTQTGAQVLVIGQNCSLAAPCNIRFGTRTFPIINSVTTTLSAGAGNTGMVFIYATVQGAQAMISAGSTMPLTVSCSPASPNFGCAYTAGLTQFPPDSIPLATWTATAGVFDLTGLVDWRAFLSTKSVIGGIGIITADVVGQTIVSADTAVVGVRVAVPASATDSCQEGNYAADSSYFYQCVAANTWRRVAVSAW
jgi:hypothetical protein